MFLYLFLALTIIWLYAAYHVLLLHGDSPGNTNTASSSSSSTLKTTSSFSSSSSVPAIAAVPEGSSREIIQPLQIGRPVSSDQLEKERLDCIWPPVAPDGSFPCGYDLLPYSDIQVPKFWTPPDPDFVNWRSYQNGVETIFIMIASYRDFQCRETITSAYARATHPERLFIGAVDQTIPGDIGCLDLVVSCEEDPNQMMCLYRDQISVYHMDANEATGPVTARHIGDRLYRGQHFAMQLDAHCLFVRNWDEQLIQQWKNTGNEMAVLSSYLSDVQHALTPEGDAKPKTRPIMCNSDFEGSMPARYLRHGAQPEDIPAIKGSPQLQPYWAAGFSFSRGHFKVRVPYDPYQPMVFQGEEIVLGIRGFTFGYDFYAPERSVIFHEYAVHSQRRKSIHMFWENNRHAGEGEKSIRRGVAIVEMAPDLDPSSWDASELDKYGLGTARNISLFYKLFLIDPIHRKARQICPFVKSGIMHRDFTAHLRPDGLGIDYSALTDYDTLTKLEAYLLSQHPVWRKHIEQSLKQKDIPGVQYGLEMAQRIGLDKKDPAFIQQSMRALEDLRREKEMKRQAEGKQG